MRLTEIKKYFHIYKITVKYSVINAMAYRTSFLIELFVEVGYQLLGIVFFGVLYGNISSLGGWTYYEMMLLLGIDIIVSELIVGFSFALNINHLSDKIRDGQFDLILTKPISSLFNATLSQPYISSFISTIPGIVLVGISLSNLDIDLKFINLIGGILLILSGVLIAYFFMVIVSSLCFIWVGASSLPRFSTHILFAFSDKPYSIYKGVSKVILYTVVPAVFLSSVPSSVILGIGNRYLIILSFIICIVLYYFSRYMWNKMIGYYSSASS